MQIRKDDFVACLLLREVQRALGHALFELLVRDPQLLGRARDRRLELRVDDGQQQRRAQDQERERRDRNRKQDRVDPGPARDRHRLVVEIRRRHTRVVHADDRRSHHGGRSDLVPAPMALTLRKAECDKERSHCCHERDHDGPGKQQPVVVDGRRHLHRGHACVMHRADAEANDEAGPCDTADRRVVAAENDQSEARHDDGNHVRRRGQREVVDDLDRKVERQHADEMHRPYARAHRERAADDPRPMRALLRAPATGRPQALREAQRHVRREYRDDVGQDDQR